jgi:hypothetical protein
MKQNYVVVTVGGEKKIDGLIAEKCENVESIHTQEGYLCPSRCPRSW